MTNKVKNPKKTVKDIASKNLSNKYIPLVEKGWWSSQEAICVFLRYPIENAHNLLSFAKIATTKEGHYLKSLVGAAESDKSVKGIVLDKICGLYRASCKAWVKWALTKVFPVENELLIAVGIKTARSKDSYRKAKEPEIRNKFLGVAAATLHVCPLAPLKEIKDVVLATKILFSLPSDKTLRKWLKNAGIKLKAKNSKKTRYEIRKKLGLILPQSSDVKAPKSALKC